MKESQYKSFEELPLFLSADLVSKTLGISPSQSYKLLNDPTFPSLRVGKRIVVPKDQFVAWVKSHTSGGAAGA